MEVQALELKKSYDPVANYRNLVPFLNRDYKRCALLVIDFTIADVSAAASTPLDALQNDMDKAVMSTRYLSQKVRQHFPYIPQIFVAFHSDDMEGRAEDQNREDILNRYVPLGQKPEDAVFIKTKRDAFESGFDVETQQGLLDYLRGNGIDTVIMCGQSITHCIRKSVQHAVKENISAVVLRECVSGGVNKLGRVRAEAIAELQEEGGKILSVFDLLRAYNMDPESLRTQLKEFDDRLPAPPKSLIERVTGRFLGYV